MSAIGSLASLNRGTATVAAKFWRGGSPAARGKRAKRFRSLRRARGWPELKKEGQETAGRRRTEPECRKAARSGWEASTHRCSAGGELGEGQEGAARRDGEAEQRRWIGRPAWCSGGVSVRRWIRTGQGALVGCSGAGGARDCGCGAAEMADDSEQSRRQSCGDGAERRRSRGIGMRPREEVKEVEEDSWIRCGNQEGARASWSSCWRPAARCGSFGRWRHDVAGRGKASRVWRAAAG
jgi:hypothetical protein